ncbi:MAG: hypothetical protein AMS21_08360 [Gemmatimonas sp. SG8_38_2]|nr:MAG: hypothetical protein AMS21_08360 [Gemmatimonas sp. SG8_38_2]
MAAIPPAVAEFLGNKRLAVVGVSRNAQQPANAVYRRLRDLGFGVFPVNPNASEVEGVRCYPNLSSLPESVQGVVIATHPDVALDVVRDCATLGVGHVWFHRSFGQGSVSQDAVDECRASGLACIVGGCPLMYCDPVDVGHKCMRWFLRLRGRVPG